ncbi:MAG: hypothetical protein N2323_01490 [candidate division WOR-3 bacterium]|nr:hypothetical protein [candidate division WOR-3 bacterium]
MIKRILIGRKWFVNKKKAEKIKSLLIQKGGEEEKINSPYEIWRIKLKDIIFTYYSTGTLYSTLTKESKEVIDIWEEINKIAGSFFVPLTKDFGIGLDETNKGEVFGPLFLIGVLIPKALFSSLEEIINSINIKKNHNLSYWQEIFKRILSYKKDGLIFVGKKIPPLSIDKYKINHLMDIGYLSILKKLTEGKDLKNLRITIDDYGVGKKLKNFLIDLAKKGVEIVVKRKADEKYLEVKTAALIGKFFKETFFSQIRNNPEYQIENLTIGSGNLNDKETKEWLNKWYEKYKEFPWFVRKSYTLIQKISEKKEKEY